MSNGTGADDNDERSELDTVTIQRGTTVVYRGNNGETADSVDEIDGDFIRVSSSRTGGGDRWLHITDLIAVGVYGDEAEWVLDEE